MEKQKLTQKVKKLAQKIVLGIGLGTAALSPIYASNPADITGDYRHCGVPFCKVIGEKSSDLEKYIGVGLMPFGKNKEQNISGLVLKAGDFKLGQVGLAMKKGPIDIGAYISYSGVKDFKPQYTLSLDLSGKYGGIGSVIDLKNPEEAQIGGRLKLKDISAYIKFGIKQLEPMFGVSYKGPATVDISYKPADKSFQARMSKGFASKYGLVIPELRFKHDEQGNVYGLGIGFIPKSKK